MDRSNPHCSAGTVEHRRAHESHLPNVPRGTAKALPAKRRPGRAGAAPSQRPRPSGSASIDCLWVTRVSGRTLGMLRLAGAGPHAARITSLRVDPEWHHTSILRNLVQEAHDYCRKLGCVTLQCGTGVAPHWMLHFLESCGFRLTGHQLENGRGVLEFRVE